MGAWNLDMGCPKFLGLWDRSCCLALCSINLHLFSFFSSALALSVHEGVEVRVDLRGKHGPQFRSQSLLKHFLFLGIFVHFLGGIASQLYELVRVLFHGHVALVEFTELIRLPLQCGFWDVVAVELFHKFIPGDGRGILGCCAVVLPPG
jgi:hypothetical protein